MATLTRNINGSYIVAPNDTLSKIATTQGRTLAELLEMNPQYQKNPNLIRPGETVNPPISSYPPEGLYGEGVSPEGYPFNYARPQTTNTTGSNVSYNNLVGGSSPSTTSYSPTTGRKMSVTEALIAILKDAQGIDLKGRESLMKQSQGIAGQGLAQAAENFRNPLLTPSAGTNLGLSAQGSFDPLQLSIENQQKLATQNLGNVTDIIDRTMSAEEKEQDRIERAEANRLNRAAKASSTSSNPGDYTPQELRKLRAEGIDAADLESSDRFLYSKETPLSSEYYPKISRALVKQFSSLFKGYEKFGNDPIQKAINFINEVGTININGKSVKLSRDQKEQLINSINSEYPEGRTFKQRLIPGGK